MPTQTRVTSTKGKYFQASEWFSSAKAGFPVASSLGDSLDQQVANSSFSLNAQTPIRKIVDNTFTSVSTPGYYVKKQVLVQWVPRKYSLSPPRAPSFRPFPLPSPPVFRSNSTRRFIERMTRKFNARYARALAKRQQYINRYNAAYSKYLKRKERYDHYADLLKNGRMAYRRVRSTEKVLVRNPYSRTIAFDFGCKGYAKEMGYSSTPTYLTKATGPYAFYKNYTIYDGVPYLWALPPDPTITLNTFAAADGRAISKLYTELNKQTVHVGNMIAERAQTFSMLAGIIKQVASVLRGNLSLITRYVGKGSTRNIGDDYLAFKFGLEPLINDAFSMAEALKRLSTTQNQDKIIVRFGAECINNGDKVTKTSVRTTTCTLTEHVKVSYSLEYKIVNAAAASLQQLGLLNPAEIAWEMMPWSFVIDWFLPIGNYIRSLSADAGLVFVGGTKTVVTRRTYTTIIDEPFNRFGYNNSQSIVINLQGQRMTETKQRTVLTSAPTVRLPSFKSPVSMTHALESLALLYQRLKR